MPVPNVDSSPPERALASPFQDPWVRCHMATLTERARWPAHPALFPTVILIVLLLTVALGAATLDVISHLHTMTDELGTVSQRLDTLDAMSQKLDTMSQKLDRLGPMQQRLDHMDSSLSALGSSLGQMNGKLDQMRVLTAQMKMLNGDLQDMRGDIHLMAHKIDGSFLFRGVK